MSSTTRTRLPWQVVLAATVLAGLAAIGAYLLLDGDDDDAAVEAVDGGSTGTLELTPADEASTSDPLDVVVTFPDGTEQAVGDALDGPTVVNLFASWCPPCVREMPAFEAVSQELAGEVAFVGLAVQDRTDDATRIVEETGVTYRWARDAKGDFATAAGITQMPSTLFVDADGEIVRVHSGALDADELRDLITSELGVDTR
ncbi:MAG TPA: TlpA disulfide reductase family protein [Acidimicrobiales bacterium]|nr:TlpA disulfide reductase family protein [Acidimicrobiales bacterium]